MSDEPIGPIRKMLQDGYDGDPEPLVSQIADALRETPLTDDQKLGINVIIDVGEQLHEEAISAFVVKEKLMAYLDYFADLEHYAEELRIENEQLRAALGNPQTTKIHRVLRDPTTGRVTGMVEEQM